MAQTSIKLTIGEIRFSYLHAFEPYKPENSEKAQYTATMLIPKSNTALVAQIRKAIKTAYDAAVTEKWGGKKPQDGYWFDPLQDGDLPKQNGEARGEEYKGHWFINAKSNNQPGVVDKHKQPILSSEEFYSGCFGYASVAFGGFTFSGKYGISCYLNNLLKSRDGEPLGGARTDAATDFAALNLDTDEDM